MWVSRVIVWIVIYGVLGWIYESAYCTIVDRKWKNCGFLFGPLCPIYGVGAVLAMIAWDRILAAGVRLEPYQVFLFAAIGSAVLEYATSWILEALFHARWWDYSNMPLDLNGRICVPATILFGFAGLFVVYVLYQPTVDATNLVSAGVFEVVALVLVALVSIDATLTISALTRFAQTAVATADAVNERMDRLVSGAIEHSSTAADALARRKERIWAQAGVVRLGGISWLTMSAIRRVRLFADMGKNTRLTQQLEELRRMLER